MGPVQRFLSVRNPDIMGRSKLWLSISSVVVALAAAGIFANGLNLGVEFTGGRVVDFTTVSGASDRDVNNVRVALGEAGFDDAVVQNSADGDLIVKVGADHQRAGPGDPRSRGRRGARLSSWSPTRSSGRSSATSCGPRR